MSEPLPPRVPRAEAVGLPAIATRLYDIEQAIERVNAELEANQREYDELSERNHFLVSEYDRLRRKLLFLAIRRRIERGQLVYTRQGSRILVDRRALDEELAGQLRNAPFG